MILSQLCLFYCHFMSCLNFCFVVILVNDVELPAHDIRMTLHFNKLCVVSTDSVLNIWQHLP